MAEKIKTAGNQVINLGCRLNIYEGEVIKKHLIDTSSTECIVINTCSVTQEALRKSKQAVHSACKTHPNKKIIVTGCAAQIKPHDFSQMHGVNLVLGNEEKMNQQSYVDLNLKDKIQVGDILSSKHTNKNIIQHFENHTRAFLEVQNGCNHRCTFCTIPFGRGNSRSTPIGSLVQQIKTLVSKGYQEVVLTGVDITDYGKDLPGEPTLGQMVKRILNLVPDLPRLRLSSVDVAEINKDLLDVIQSQPRFMPHIHLSLQSGDNMILKRMKRRHTREQVLKFCSFVRTLRPEIAFGADIIAGFPTETEEMFQNTIDLVREAKIQFLHVFPFSPHENTPASRMPQVAFEKRKIRANILIKEGKQQQQEFFSKHLNTHHITLIEKNNKGYTENYIPIKVEGGVISPNTLIKVRLKHANTDHVLSQKVT